MSWTQQQLADRLTHLAWMERREHVGVNADMVATWERGVKGVKPALPGWCADCSVSRRISWV
ncbi:MAG: hypothetical protein ACRDTE_08310 [Pseudonocardiaceae bacterium]